MEMSRKDDVFKRALEAMKAIEDKTRELLEYEARLRELFIECEKQIWRFERAEKPVDPEDRAISWCKRKLASYRETHPKVDYEFAKDDRGLITGLWYTAGDEEEAEAIRRMARWAFEKAANRPFKGRESRGGSPRGC